MRILALALLILLLGCEDANVIIAFCSNTCGDTCDDCHSSSSIALDCRSFCETGCNAYACISISSSPDCEDTFRRSCEGDF